MAKLRMGMVGGGEGSFIGSVHRMAAELDGQIQLVCGAFSSNPERSMKSGIDIYGLSPERCYGSYAEMYEVESSLPEDLRMEFVVIATPNHVHFPIAKAALESGFHVMSDKPMTYSLEEALQLQSIVDEKQLIFGLTHNYTGYPMVREARELIQRSAIGDIRRVNVEYIQGWLSAREESQGNKQAEWRTDPSRSGVAGCMGDIGTHGINLVEFVTGLQITSLCADLNTFVPGRKLDDDGNVLLRFENGAKGVLCASQIAVGVENGLTLRIYGEKGGIEWAQMEPNSLTVRWSDRPYEIRRTGGSGVHEEAQKATRLPAGHPEGFLEAFGLLYRNFATSLCEFKEGKSLNQLESDFPSLNDGIRGMAFIESVVRSSNEGTVWVDLVTEQ